MTIIVGLLCFSAGVWAESNFDLSGHAITVWRRVQAWRRGP